MTIIYRAEKGSPLTTHEIDGNFKELETRIDAPTEHPEIGEGIGKIHVEGDQISFQGTFGTNFGSFSLPKPKLTPCGPWATQTPYRKLDLAMVENSLYCCITDHISTIWPQDSPFWKQALSFPQPPPSTLVLYEKASLPKEETMRKLALLLEEETPTLIFFNGNTWQRLIKGETL